MVYTKVFQRFDVGRLTERVVNLNPLYRTQIFQVGTKLTTLISKSTISLYYWTFECWDRLLTSETESSPGLKVFYTDVNLDSKIVIQMKQKEVTKIFMMFQSEKTLRFDNSNYNYLIRLIQFN